MVFKVKEQKKAPEMGAFEGFVCFAMFELPELGAFFGSEPHLVALLDIPSIVDLHFFLLSAARSGNFNQLKLQQFSPFSRS